MKQANTNKKALISVSNKQNIVEFAQSLVKLGFDIISTGGTFKTLIQADIPATEVADITGFPEIMDGRVKTLHPKIHGGLLARIPKDQAVLQTHDIPVIDLVVVNLYPFQETISKADTSFNEAIENIDIGGPTMIRAAAKNQNRVTVVVDTQDYQKVTQSLQESTQREIPFLLRAQLAAKAFAHTAAYDASICGYLSRIDPDEKEHSQPVNTTENSTQFPQHLVLPFEKLQSMRYGENPHQNACFYRSLDPTRANVTHATLIQGKALSFNNIADADTALETVKSFSEPACVIVKHANPCGVAVAKQLLDAYQLAFATDPTSAFGGIIAFNREIDATTAENILSKQFVEVIIAPNLSADAKTLFQKKPNIRVLITGKLPYLPAKRMEFKAVNGGILVQEADTQTITEQALKRVSKRQPSAAEMRDLLFAWQVAKFVKSNAIVYVKNQQTIGIGAGQMSRVYSAKIAAIKAKDENLEVPGSVMASDAFFPFRDGIDMAAKAGITAVIQPGGSVRDEEVIAAADEAEMAMIFTGIRHFRH